MKELLREIHRRFRLAMNGVVAASMREKGVGYKVIFGVSISQLKAIASCYEPDRELAEALWKEDIRESRLLAVYLFPRGEMDRTTAFRWIEEVDVPEVGDVLCMVLLQYLPFASELVLSCIAADDFCRKRIGYALAGRLFAGGKILNGDFWQAFIVRAKGDVVDTSSSMVAFIVDVLKHAVRSGGEKALPLLQSFESNHLVYAELKSEYDYCRSMLSGLED